MVRLSQKRGPPRTRRLEPTTLGIGLHAIITCADDIADRTEEDCDCGAADPGNARYLSVPYAGCDTVCAADSQPSFEPRQRASCAAGRAMGRDQRSPTRRTAGLGARRERPRGGAGDPL